jgi:glycosyltransferase involved in cell wall biosynthesis
MKHTPQVSIIIPTYNRAGMVAGAIESALGQTYPNKEVIVVDDGSDDETAAIVKNYPSVIYIVQPHAGQAAARNGGWKQAKGTYIATLDSDDVWQDDFLERCISFLEAHNLDFVFANWDQQTKEGGLMDFFANDPLLKPYLPRVQDGWILLKDADLRDLYVRGCPSPSSALVLRASSIVSGWNEEMNIADDWCMLLDMIFSRPCLAAMTTQKLWLKHINCNNIYDGRDHIEVNKLLYVADTQTIMQRHAPSMTKAEYKIMEERYLEHLVRSAKHSLFLDSNVTESISLMKRAMVMNPVYSAKILSKLFVQAGIRQFKKDPD